MATYQATMIDDSTRLYTGELVRDPRTFPAVTPWRADLVAGAAPSGLSPGVDNIMVLTSTSIRVYFEYPAVDNAALRATSSYSISPSLAVHSVTPENVATPLYVDLEIDEQKTGEMYALSLVRLERA